MDVEESSVRGRRGRRVREAAETVDRDGHTN